MSNPSSPPASLALQLPIPRTSPPMPIAAQASHPLLTSHRDSRDSRRVSAASRASSPDTDTSEYAAFANEGDKAYYASPTGALFLPENTGAMVDTEDEDEVDELARRLEGFHVSARMRREADGQDAQPSSPGSTDSSWPDRDASPSRWAKWRDNKMASRCTLHVPKPGERPCWEPPVFDYDHFQPLIEAQMEFVAGEGRKDIAFVTDIMDNNVECDSHDMYSSFVYEHLNEKGVDREFWGTLWNHLDSDWEEIAIVERESILERYGKTQGDWFKTMAGVAKVMIKQAEGKEANPLRGFGMLKWALEYSKQDAESGNLVEME